MNGVESSYDCDSRWMRLALDLAATAAEAGEVPVGAVVVKQGVVVSQAYNLRETLSDPTAHAERLALTLAGKALGTWRLGGCSLYVTLEPCIMCAGAAVLSRIDRLIFGAVDPKAGACQSLYRLTSDPRLNHRVAVTTGILKDDCGAILSEFFRSQRPNLSPN